jgi:hypothetical protein
MPPSDRIEGPDDVGTWLVIPYYDGDTGAERPVPNTKAISYLCRSIIVDGEPGVFTLRRGVPMGVTVDVGNWGSGALTAAVQVRVWWADPSTVFAMAHPFGQAVVLVQPGEVVRTGVMRGTIPLTAPSHVCLLVHVAAPLDGAGKTAVPDPAGDRHWAQANLTEAVAAEDGTVKIPFLAGNPFDAVASARFGLRPLADAEIDLMRELLQRDFRTLPAENVAVLNAGGDVSEVFDLQPGAEPLTLQATFPEGIPAGVECHMVLTQTIEREGREPLQGSLGVRLSAPS